ncbi:MAG: AsmA family protein [Deltaproteobacteria bacterium]|nr:MAG: AsmA family protein [Deltaproteobacteria bacterium]
MRRHRHLLIAIAVVAALLFAADLAARSLTLARLRLLVEEDLTDALGLAVSVDALQLSLLPYLHLDARGVRVANLPDRPSPHLLEVGEIEIGVALWPLRKRIVAIDAFELRDGQLNIETDTEGGFALPLELGGDVAEPADDPVVLEVRRLAGKDLRVFRRDGVSGVVRSLRLDAIELESEERRGPISIAASGAVEGAPCELEGRIGPLHELLEPTRPFPVRIAARIYDAHIEAEGTLAAPRALAGVDLRVSAEIPDLALAGWPLPGLGAIALTAHISDLDGTLGLEALDLETTRDDPFEADVEGRVDDLAGLRGVELRAGLAARDLDFLETWVDAPIPDVASATATATLSDDDGSLGLHAELHAEAPEPGIALDAEGRWDDLSRIGEIDVVVRGSAREIASVAALVQAPELPDLGPLEFSGRVLDRDGALGIDALQVRMGRRSGSWVDVSGSIGDILERRRISLDVGFGTADLRALGEAFGRSLPPIARIDGSARLSDADGTLGIEDLELRAGERGLVEVRLTAELDDLFGRDEFEVVAELRARDLAVLGAAAELELAPIGPVEFKGRLRGSNEALRATGVALRVGETRLRGDASGSFVPDERPALRARIESPHVRIADLGFVRRTAAAEPAALVPPEAETLPFEELRALDLDLELRAKRITGYAGLDVQNAHVTVRLHDGELLIGDAAASYKQGRVRAEAEVDARTPDPHLAVNLDAKAIDLAVLMAQFEEDSEVSGLLDATLGLKSRGATLDALRASLSGNTRVVVRDGTVASKYGRMFVVNLGRAAFPMLRTPKAPRLGCTVAEFEIEDGIATAQTILLEGGEVAVTGAGRIDLVRGVYELRFVPTARDPGLLSVAPQVDVRGPLANPVFRPVTSTLATSLGRGLLSNARRAGLSALRPFRSRNEALVQGKAACAKLGLSGP